MNKMIHLNTMNQMTMNQNSINRIMNVMPIGMGMIENQMLNNQVNIHQLNNSDESIIDLYFLGFLDHKKIEIKIQCKKNDYFSDIVDKFCFKSQIPNGHTYKYINSCHMLNNSLTVSENHLYNGCVISFIDENKVVFG